ncbi:MAG: hypothetical protein FJ109_20500 [Deltaproteobacteria bacterium]|nr:hypothetical protein [Deltaproteobacteria bacterium]
MLQQAADWIRGRLDAGYSLDEVMSGTHEFEPGAGPPGIHPFRFVVTWGATSVRRFLEPGEQRLAATLSGAVTAGGLCSDAPCRGALRIDYFGRHMIRYDFEFTSDQGPCRFVGEKVNIQVWNLPVSHTTCFGTVTRLSDGRLLSRAVVHFRLRTLPAFLASLRLKAATP